MDCDESIKLEPTYVKSYYRKAKAQFDSQQLQEAVETLKLGIQSASDNETLHQLMTEVKEEIENDNSLE